MPTVEEALIILKHDFGIAKPQIEWIQNEPYIQVWKIHVNDKNYALKCTPKTNTFLLSILLQHELYKQRVNVPQVIQTREQTPYAENKYRYFFLSKFIEQTDAPSLKDQVMAVGEFHQKAFLPASLSSYRANFTKITNKKDWLQEYLKKINQIKDWIKQFSLSEDFDACFNMAENCIRLMKISSLEEHIKMVNENGLLCHGDFCSDNMVNSKKRYIIDLDDTRIDSPIKDLRTIPVSNALMRSLYDNYFTEYPFGKTFEELYYIDALFPHRTYFRLKRFIREQILHANLPFIRELILREIEKEKMIMKLLNNPKWKG